MNEKYKLLALLIEVYYINKQIGEYGWTVQPPELQEKIKNQIEDSTGLNIEKVLRELLELADLADEDILNIIKEGKRKNLIDLSYKDQLSEIENETKHIEEIVE